MTARYTQPHPTSRTWRILLVQGDRRLRSSCGAALAARQCDVFEVDSLSAARHELALGDFDAIITDMSLRDGNGFAVVLAARRAGQTSPVLVGPTMSSVGAPDGIGIWFASKPVAAELFDAIYGAAASNSKDQRRRSAAVTAPVELPYSASITTPMRGIYA